jgi:hypothetical protein
MNREIAKLWTEALRSGQYEQAIMHLRYDDKFCCLGVLCDLHNKQHPEIKWEGVEGLGGLSDYLGSDTTLPEEVRAWAGMKSGEGSYLVGEGNFENLVLKNDDGETFSNIAEIIDEHVDAL